MSSVNSRLAAALHRNDSPAAGLSSSCVTPPDRLDATRPDAANGEDAAPALATASLERVEAALLRLRAGGAVRLDDGLRIRALEVAGRDRPRPVESLILPRAEGAVLGRSVQLLDLQPPVDAACLVDRLLDPKDRTLRTLRGQPGERAHRAAIELCKLAGLLPAAAIEPAGSDGAPIDLATFEVEAFREAQARSVHPVVDARMPLRGIDDVRLVAFRAGLSGVEHVAVLIGAIESSGRAPLCRLHSACFTGDIFGSMRCDCGEQLQGAIDRIAAEGAGLILYMAQEGRGIGLVNKLRAYRLQDAGFDTIEANEFLGFMADERDWLMAALMLRRLGIDAIRLLTNNPAKVTTLRAHGIEVVERVPHAFAANPHNHGYLATKAARSGHLLGHPMPRSERLAIGRAGDEGPADPAPAEAGPEEG